MPEMQMQVNQLREAFSADVNRPFELKRGFPFESPSPSTVGLQPSPPLDINIKHPMLTRHESLGQQDHMPYHAAPITPPISSAGLSFEDSKDNLLMSGSMHMMPSSQQQAMPMQTTPMSIGQEWNPTPIFAYVSGASKLRLVLTEVTVSGTMRLDRGMLRLHNNLHHSIHHQLLRKYLSHCINRRIHILSRRACRHYRDSKRHHSYLHILLQRLHSSHQVCGATLSPAHTTLQGTSDVGTWKTMARFFWTTPLRRSARGRLRTYSHFFHLHANQGMATNGCITTRAHGVLCMATFCFLRAHDFDGGYMLRTSDDIRHSFLPICFCLSFLEHI